MGLWATAGLMLTLATGVCGAGVEPYRIIGLEPGDTPAAKPANSSAPKATADDLEDQIFYKVRSGGAEYVVLMRGKRVESVTSGGKQLSLDRARVNGENLEVLDEQGQVAMRVTLAKPMISNALPVTPERSGPGAWSAPSPAQAPSKTGRVVFRNGTLPPSSPAAPMPPVPPVAAANDDEDLGWRSVMVGLRMVAIEPALAGHLGLDRSLGVMVAGVAKGLPAEAAGLKPYDVITEIDGKPVTSVNFLREVLLQRKAAPGEMMKFKIFSGGTPKEVSLTLAPFDRKTFTTLAWTAAEPAVEEAAAPAALPGQQAAEAMIAGRARWAELDAVKALERVNRLPIVTTIRSGEGQQQVMIMPDAPRAASAEERLEQLEERLANLTDRLESMLAALNRTAGQAPSTPSVPTAAPAKDKQDKKESKDAAPPKKP